MRIIACVLAVCLAVAGQSLGQTSSLFRPQPPPMGAPALTAQDVSLIHLPPPPPPRLIKKNDLIAVRVDQKSAFIAEGEIQRRRNLLHDSVLADWIHLAGLDLKPSKQADGDPRITGQLAGLNRSEGEMETRESLVTEIAAEVVDIRPNGLLVLQARSIVNNNEELWEFSLTGVCRPEDVAPNNVVLSRNLAHLRIDKRECGHVRDSYRRGWLGRWIEDWRPF